MFLVELLIQQAATAWFSFAFPLCNCASRRVEVMRHVFTNDQLAFPELRLVITNIIGFGGRGTKVVG
jgi:hypothetical protein